MFGRQIFLKPEDNQRDQRRYDELFRQFSANQRQGIPFAQLSNIPSFRNDGLMLDLNFILVDDTDRVPPNNAYFRTNYGNVFNRYLLEYIRQMEERYLAMERELTRAKMLIPVIARNTGALHQTSQTDVGKIFFGCSPRNQPRKNREQVNHFSSRKKHHPTKKNKDYVAKSLVDAEWPKHKYFPQNSPNDIYPIKEPGIHSPKTRTSTSNATSACSVHNVAVILPQGSTRFTDFSRHVPNNSKVSMDICQSFDKKREPETTCYANFDVKHEHRMQINSSVNTPEFRSTIKPKLNNNASGEKSEVEQPPCHRSQMNTDFERKCIFNRTNVFENTNTSQKEYLQCNHTPGSNNTYWNNRSKKYVCNERTCENNYAANDDPSRYFTQTIQKPKKDGQKKVPTPRSHVHTAYTPMVQSPTWNPIIDPNGLTIQLLRLAVLLYAPTLMPALNSLIARQSVQTSIPIPGSDGANDLFAQIFTILNNQQRIPNLSYVPNPRFDESSHHRESNLQNSSHSEDTSRQFRNVSQDKRTSASDQFEKNSIAINTSLEICDCNSVKESSSRYNENALHDRKTEEKEKLLYSWTEKKSKSSETVVLENLTEGEEKKEKDVEEKQDEAELSANSLMHSVIDTWGVNDYW